MINFNGKTEIDVLGYTPQGTPAMTLKDRLIMTPEKVKIKVSVPFMSNVLDFSTVGSMGDIVYKQREIDLIFSIYATSKWDLMNKRTLAMNWLKDQPKSKLIFDDDPGFYYLGEIETTDSSEFTENYTYGEFKAIFICDPYKYSNELYGDLLWDDIDFNLPDYIQDTQFDVVGSKTVTIYVPGNHSIVPTVVVDANMSCILNSYTANFIPTNNTDFQFILKPGLNTIQITGTGNIDFQFEKELL